MEKFKKIDLLKSVDFLEYKDALNVILDDEEEITKSEAEKRLKKFLDKKEEK